MKKEKQSYWYLTTHFECPVCGKGETIRERQYSPKPKEDHKRYEWVPKYDYCQE